MHNWSGLKHKFTCWCTKINWFWTLEAQVSTVVGAAENIITGSGTLEAQVSTVLGAAARTPVSTASGALQAQVSSVDGLGVDKHVGSGTLESQASTVVGDAEREVLAPAGALQAQASTVVGVTERTDCIIWNTGSTSCYSRWCI